MTSILLSPREGAAARARATDRVAPQEATMAELIEIPSPGIPLYFGEVGNPVVLLVHDWYGRLPGLDDYAKALAHVGFRVVVPDLYSGVATLDADTAESLMQQLD